MMLDLSTNQIAFGIIVVALRKKRFSSLQAYFKFNDVMKHGNSLRLKICPTFSRS